MKISIIAILISLYAIGYGQQDSVQLDTITPTTYSQEAMKQLISELQTIEAQRQELMTKIMLIVSAYIDPKTFVGFTPDHKILKKK